MELPMIDTTTIDQLRQRMIKDMRARNLGPASQKSSLPAYRRFATWLRRSPDTAMAEDFRLFQLHLAEVAVGTVTRNASMAGHRFLFRANLRRHDLAAEIFHVKEQQKAPLILNQGETKRLLTVARTLRDPCCSAWLMCELFSLWLRQIRRSRTGRSSSPDHA